MHLFYLAARTYPYWAVPVAIVFGQLGIHFMRRDSVLRFLFFGIAAGLVVGAFAWIFFRGDLHSDVWVRTLLG